MYKRLNITIMFVVSLTIMASTVVAPIIPIIEQEYKLIPNIDLFSRLVLTLPSLFVVICAPLAGNFLKTHNRLPTLKFFLILYAFSGVSGYFINNIYLLLLSRAILGISVAFIITIIFSLISEYSIEYKLNKNSLLSIAGFSSSFGGVIFIFMSGILSSYFWKNSFLIYLISVISLGLVVFFFKEPQWINVSSKNVKINLRKYILIYLVTFLMMLMFYILPTQYPYFIINILHGSTINVGVIIGSTMLLAAIVSLYFKQLKQKFSFFSLYILTIILFAIGLMIIGYAKNIYYLIPAILFLGISSGIIMVISNAWLFSNIKEENPSKIVSISMSMNFLGQFLAAFLYQYGVKLFGNRDIFINFSWTILVLVGIVFLYKVMFSK